jgi:hypothetical protein
MRASHCSKTYQLGLTWPANSACFRAFLTKITGFSGFLGVLYALGVPYGIGSRDSRRSAGPLRLEQNPLKKNVVLPLPGDLQVGRSHPDPLETRPLQDCLGARIVGQRSGLEAVQA